MAIPTYHPPISVDGTVYGLDHLNLFSAAIPGKGLDAGTDLVIEVAFSNHVYTDRAKHGEPHHFVDHHGTKRTFDLKRYEMSKTLRAALTRHIMGNGLTHVSKSYGGIDNLVFIETEDRQLWAVVYCLHPLEDSSSVRMDVLSCHPKIIDQKSISRRNLSYFARQCLFMKARVPKA